MCHVKLANESFEFLISHKMPLNTFRKKNPYYSRFMHFQISSITWHDDDVIRVKPTHDVSIDIGPPTHRLRIGMIWHQEDHNYET